MVRIALTGGIATGKSYVTRVLAERGVPTIDADVLARAALDESAAAEAVRRRFGDAVFAHGVIDRGALAAVVFSDSAARRDLEAIVHPLVYRRIETWFDALPSDTPFAVADIPLLFETGRDKDFDCVVVVACSVDLQVRRVVSRDGTAEADARARIAAQWPIDEKIARADYLISTEGTLADTDRQVDALLARLQAKQDDRTSSSDPT